MPMNPNSCILEIRGATGGDEAKIWASDLLRMYLRYCQSQGWKAEFLNDHTLRVRAESAFLRLQYESGTHRVQRIPSTERYGRIHTSTATVAVLPEVPETEVVVRPEDLEWEFYRSGGKGGQNVNKVSSAVRLRHKPSGIVVCAQTERDQFQNRNVALTILRSRLWEQEELKRQQTMGQARSIIGRGMRAEKIRTYNFPQNRITDHRINKSWHDLENIMDGKLEKVFTTLTASFNQ